ncbi:MAG: alanine--glyoxylate aminotransferase family protein, partial [Youngiibacter sp.]|nr:alanine--glyoxylate aminotransferase family protein [Youngiibacter sp.]
LAIVWAGKKALERRQQLGTIPEFYIDFEKWMPIMENPAKYFATPAVNLIWALKDAVRIINEEGLEARQERHRKVAAATQAAMEALGFRILAEEGVRAVTLSNLIYPEGIDDLEFRNTLSEEGVFVAGGLGAYAGRMFRLGHMGNIDMHDSVSAIAAIERTLYRLGKHTELGKGVGVFMKEMME